MSLRIDKVQLQFELNQDKTLQNIEKAKKALNDESKALKKLKEGTPEFAAQLKKVQEAESVYQKLASDMKITEMPMEMLVKRQKELNLELSKMRPDTENYRLYKQELDAVKARIVELKGTASSTSSSLEKVATSTTSWFDNVTSSINKYATTVAATVFSIISAFSKANKYSDEYAAMEEAESLVVKYTNMTKKEVEELNEDFKKMDTRTAREQLNALAGDAGKLGIDGKKNIEDFVDAGNQINISLGEDLGQDAIKNIGKLAIMFGEDERLGLKKAMLSTGSAINYIGQSSSAAEPYLAEFLGRMGSVGHQANISQANLLGFASVLDQNKVESEIASTAFQQLTLKMFQEPTKYAKIAGVSIKEFTGMLKTDANSAMLSFLSGLSKYGDLTKMAPVIKSLGLDGQRTNQVLSALSGNIELIRSEQEKATKAYKDAVSVTQEYDIQNNTPQAQLEKNRKAIHDLEVELGEKLFPLITESQSLMTSVGRTLLETGKFIVEHKTSIIMLTTALVFYTVAVNASIIADKVKIFWNTAVVQSFKILYAVIAANPWTAVIAVMAVVAGYYADVKEKTDAVTRANDLLNESKKESESHQSDEITNIQMLLKIARDENASKKDRINAINRLNDIMPDYIDKLSLETINTAEASVALERYVKLLKIKDQIEDVKHTRQKFADEMDSPMQYTVGEEWVYNISKWINEHSGNVFRHLGNIVESYDKEIAARKDDKTTGLKVFDNELEGLYKQMFELDKPLPKKGKPKTLLTDTTNKKGNPYQDDTKTMEAKRLEELNNLKKTAQEKNETENEYNLAAIEINKKYLEQRLELIKKYEAKTKDKGQKAQMLKDEQDTQSALIDIDKQKGDAQIKVLEERRDEALKSNDEYYNQQKQELAKQYAEGTINQSTYDATVAANELESKNYRLQILQGYGEDVNNEEIKNGQIKEKAVKDANDAIVQAEVDFSTSRAGALQSLKNVMANFQKESGLTSPEMEKAEKLKVLQETYDQQRAILIANHQDTLKLDELYKVARLAIEKDYQSALLDIQEKNGIDVTKQRYVLELTFLKARHDAGLASDKEYNAKLGELDDDYLNGKLGKWGKAAQYIADVSGNVSSAISGFAEAETIASDAKYDHQIKIAKKAGKDTTKLEEQKEAAQYKIKKKYADLQFATAVLQIASTTAVTAMEAYKAMAGIKIIGPVLGAAAAAAAVLAGAGQISVAKANRDAAKGLYEGGYSGDYSGGGYTPKIDPHDVGGYIPVHGDEFVGNHEAVANPHVNRFFRVIDLAQKNGTIRMLDTTAILNQLQLGAGKYSGGYTNNQSGNPIVMSDGSTIDIASVINRLDKVVDLLTTMSGKKIVLSMTDVRDGLNDLKTYESNASR